MGTKEKAPSLSASVCLLAVLACSCLLLAAISLLSRQQPYQNLSGIGFLQLRFLFLGDSSQETGKRSIYYTRLSADNFNCEKTSPRSPAALDLEGKREAFCPTLSVGLRNLKFNVRLLKDAFLPIKEGRLIITQSSIFGKRSLLLQAGNSKDKIWRQLTNARGHKLRCSHYLPSPFPEETPLPCVIYCHGNSGCRADANEAAVILLPSNITVFTLDFSGSGLSDGDYVSLGWHERDDLKIVVSYLRSERQISRIGLWGRSMGAVTSLLYGAEDPSIAGMVLDSAFSNLFDLMMELVDVYKIRLPKFTNVYISAGFGGTSTGMIITPL
ncbi:hypothetical protein Gohar_023719, partial [Gossypium harknessii]|nr:hypothetical protein [Gossypium harknessii]